MIKNKSPTTKFKKRLKLPLYRNLMTTKKTYPKYNEKDWKNIAEQIKKQMRPLSEQNPEKEWSGEVICTFEDIDNKNKKK